MEPFTIRVTLASKSKAKENDWKPKKTWKQYCQELAEKNEGRSDSDRRTTENATDSDTDSEPRIQDDEDSEIHGHQENDGQESDNDVFAEFRWMEQMDGVVLQNNALHPEKPSRVGYCDAKLMRRSHMYSFYSDLEQPSRETCRLAFELFDRYGRLKNVFKEHTVKKGSGIWGDELDSGNLLLIEQISLQAPYRRQGLGRKLVEAILEKTYSKSNSFFAVVAPGWLNRIISMETEGASDVQVKKVELRHQATAETFFRSLGFRIHQLGWLLRAVQNTLAIP